MLTLNTNMNIIRKAYSRIYSNIGIFATLCSVTIKWGPAPAPGMRPPGLVGATATAGGLWLLRMSGRLGASSAAVLGLVSPGLLGGTRSGLHRALDLLPDGGSRFPGLFWPKGVPRFWGLLPLRGIVLGDNDQVLGFPRLGGFLCKGSPGLGILKFTGAPGDACDQAVGLGPPLAVYLQLGSLTPSSVCIHAFYLLQVHQPLQGGTQPVLAGYLVATNWFLGLCRSVFLGLCGDSLALAVPLWQLLVFCSLALTTLLRQVPLGGLLASVAPPGWLVGVGSLLLGILPLQLGLCSALLVWLLPVPRASPVLPIIGLCRHSEAWVLAYALVLADNAPP